MPYDDWREALVAACANSEADVQNALYPLLPMFAADKAKMGSRDTMPLFSCANTEAALNRAAQMLDAKPHYAKYNLRIPPAKPEYHDEEIWDNYVQYFVKQNFLPPPLSDGDGGVFAF